MGALIPEEMKFGLIAVDRRELEADPAAEAVILHFCGYAEKPTQQDVNDMFKTMAETPEFGVSDKMQFIDVYDAPETIVEQYRAELLSGDIKEVKIDDDGKVSFAADSDSPD